MHKDYEILESSGLFAIKNKDLSIVRCNTNFLVCNGKKTEKDICGLDDFNLPWREYAEIYHKHDLDALLGKIYKQIVPVVDWKKRASVVINHKRPIFDNNNVVTGLISHATDVTGTIVEGIVGNFMKFLPPEVTKSFTIENKQNTIKLSKRQKQCLLLLARGKTATDIANILNISNRTAEHYIDDVKVKLNCATKQELIDASLKKGYINIIPSETFAECLHLLEV